MKPPLSGGFIDKIIHLAEPVYLPRLLERSINATLAKKSVLVLGPRQTGKSSLIRNAIPVDRTFSLLDQSTFTNLSRRPSSLRESLKETDRVIAVDEIQKLPQLMDEIHLMIEEQGKRFLLTGSSARKLRRTHTGLMAGRARSLHLHPFVTAELDDYTLERVLSFGMLPPVVHSDTPGSDLTDYVGDYLQQEILAEALTRSIDQYSRFFSQVATMATQVLNIEKLASDAQLAPTTVRRFLDILTDTLIAMPLEPWREGGRRKAVAASKLIFFDVGVVNALLGTPRYSERDRNAGWQFEQFIGQELWAYRDYRKRDAALSFWRSTDKHEVDFILDGRVAIEVKHTSFVTPRDLKGLVAIADEGRKLRRIVVSRDPAARRIEGIEILPYREFLSELWNDRI
jgi:predicted AAA+ superfamily ATPase